VALSSFSGDGLNRSDYGHLVAEIKALMRDREFIPRKLSRNQNGVADRLANYSRIECTMAAWMHLGPPCHYRNQVVCRQASTDDKGRNTNGKDFAVSWLTAKPKSTKSTLPSAFHRADDKVFAVSQTHVLPSTD
jgi:hypothetical protein